MFLIVEEEEVNKPLIIKPTAGPRKAAVVVRCKVTKLVRPGKCCEPTTTHSVSPGRHRHTSYYSMRIYGQVFFNQDNNISKVSTKKQS